MPVRIGEQAPLESLLGAEGLGRLGAMVAVDSEGVLQGVVTLAEVRRRCDPPRGLARALPQLRSHRSAPLPALGVHPGRQPPLGFITFTNRVDNGFVSVTGACACRVWGGEILVPASSLRAR